jgi:outer membrane lipoprotein SlyB
MNTKLALPAAMVLALACGGVVQAEPPAAAQYTQIAQNDYVAYGYVDSVESVHVQPHNSAGGAVVGGLIGGLLGHQVGRGSGNTAATVAGAVGGAVVGNEVEKRHDENAGHDYFRVHVHLENGGELVVNQPDAGDLRSGDRVRVENDRVYRY